MEVVASLSQGCTAAAHCSLFTHKSVPVVFETPCSMVLLFILCLPYAFFPTLLLNKAELFLISNFCRVLNLVCFLLGNSPASEFYTSTFRNTLSVPSSQAYEDGKDSVFQNIGI